MYMQPLRPSNYMLGSCSSIIRRQQFLINNQTHQRFTTQSMMSRPALEADDLGVLRSITPSLDPTSHKGAGNLPQTMDCVSDIIKHARNSNVPIVIDGVCGQTSQAHKRLVQKVLNCEVNDQHVLEQLLLLAKRQPYNVRVHCWVSLVKKAASLAFENKRRSTLTGDIIECLGKSLEEICLVS